jgi:serine phosphatase RsbU (regulator of sigma subunit)
MVLFEIPLNIEEGREFVFSLLNILISIIFVASLTYIFSCFRELFYLRQKRDPHKYFNTMIVFLSLAFLTKFITIHEKELEFVGASFFVVSIVLIAINSLRVAWIAFLIKKQKLLLLVISVALSALFALNFALTLETSFIHKILTNFSPGLLIAFKLMMLYGAIYFGVIFFTTLFHLPTAEAFDRKAEEASSLMDLSKIITEVFDFKELADTVTSLTTQVCGSDAAWLVIRDGEKYELTSVNNIGYVEADRISNILINEGSISDNEVITFDRKLIKIKIKTDVRTFEFKALAIAPLKVHEENKGYLFTGRKQYFAFDEDEKKSVEAFADYAAVALENAKLIEQSIEKERLESELNAAREIQYKILPSKTPKDGKLNISALFVPAFEVGGDYYDFFDIGNEMLGFVIADVSGKGIQAAFIMAEVKGIFESLSRLILSPKELLTRANDILRDSLERKSFVTAVYGVFDKKNNKLTFARAGHVPVYLCRDGRVEKLVPAGIGLGLDNSDTFEDNLKEMEIELNNNDIVALYTDGITESKNIDQEEFGDIRFEKILCEHFNSDVDQLSNEIMKKVTTFSEKNIQHDDITLVLVKWFNNNNPSGVN